jgi:hypothetical protein
MVFYSLRDLSYFCGDPEDGIWRRNEEKMIIDDARGIGDVLGWDFRGGF